MIHALALCFLVFAGVQVSAAEVETTCVYVAGRKGCGKSHLLASLVLEHHRAYPGMRFIVWDTTGEWAPSEDGRIVVLDPDDCPDPQDAAQLALDTADDVGACVLIMDEVDIAAPNHGGGLRRGDPLHTIVRYGRHRRTALVCASQRSAGVHIDIPALADTLYLFRATHYRDLDWITKICGADVAEQVANLPPRRFIRHDQDR